MSATRTSGLAAGLIADVVVEEAGAGAASRRLYLGEHLGVSPGEIFEELAGRCDTEIVIRGETMGAVASDRDATGPVLLIPYLVTDAASAGRNHGSEGFAAL